MFFLKSKAWNRIFLMFKRSQRFIGLGVRAVVFFAVSYFFFFNC